MNPYTSNHHYFATTFQNQYHLLNAMANLEEELVAGGLDMGRTWTSRTLWMPQARQLQSTETTIQMPIKKIQKP